MLFWIMVTFSIISLFCEASWKKLKTKSSSCPSSFCGGHSIHVPRIQRLNALVLCEKYYFIIIFHPLKVIKKETNLRNNQKLHNKFKVMNLKNHTSRCNRERIDKLVCKFQYSMGVKQHQAVRASSRSETALSEKL